MRAKVQHMIGQINVLYEGPKKNQNRGLAAALQFCGDDDLLAYSNCAMCMNVAPRRQSEERQLAFATYRSVKASPFMQMQERDRLVDSGEANILPSVAQPFRHGWSDLIFNRAAGAKHCAGPRAQLLSSFGYRESDVNFNACCFTAR